MSKQKGRGLTPEERSVWQQVADSTRRLSPKPKNQIFESSGATDSPTKRPNQPMTPFSVGSKSTARTASASLAPTPAESLGQAPLRMDKRAFTKLKRGKLSPEARIDLHGMTLAQAHPALVGFVMDAKARGLRLILVITGKGKSKPEPGPIPTRTGVLRHQVPQWLSLPPIGPLVLQVTPSHLRHGGEGAYYVYLRR